MFVFYFFFGFRGTCASDYGIDEKLFIGSLITAIICIMYFCYIALLYHLFIFIRLVPPKPVMEGVMGVVFFRWLPLLSRLNITWSAMRNNLVCLAVSIDLFLRRTFDSSECFLRLICINVEFLMNNLSLGKKHR